MFVSSAVHGQLARWLYSSYAAADSLAVQFNDGVSSNPSFLFSTNTADVVEDGYDALGNRYVVLRTYGSVANPARAGEIYASSCCRPSGLGGSNALDSFRFAVNYVPGTYNYTFVPAVSSHGAAISCSINTDLTNTSPGELTVSTAPGGCRLGWRNFGYNYGAMTGVGLRISEPSTGHYIDIIFRLVFADLGGQPVLSSNIVSTTGQVLPQSGGNIIVYVGVPVTPQAAPCRLEPPSQPHPAAVSHP
ncbi:hypothetical protein VOLCADRAFT_89071 [Volvox carteri f. nagariensis]|uniref:Pherophorin domain-containing protein n=1 Tax=Volvox carteri f. nagariensis TaxID=3068 RepID=D8TQQ7_VOLCA|nr:uncharacterized protein VOLCADRAFT_89071 [Volvox carteri f. nagariensis]EFJ50195.1 hypothetical protein VOLCADRAFT_89071 [Volvox carteri f. nagariensis]|eukprot:XP_002948815.1 hypothetical protein VOLCADRAFT_89071 [Volvox carteri f. nagariensis]